MKAFPYSKKDQKLFFVAEIGSNHNGSLIRLESLIRIAKQTGCNAVKLQYYNPDTLWSSEFPENRKSAAKGKLTWQRLEQAVAIAKANKIAIGCSVFDVKDVQKVANIVDFVKVASLECLWKDLTDACRKSGKPFFLSTGTCNNLEMIKAVRNCWPTDKDVLFHCSALYPSSIENARLDILKYLVHSYKYKGAYKHIGYSDHTALPSVIYSSIMLGATVIECHIDLLDCQGSESQHNHCWLPSALTRTIITSHQVKEIMHANRKYDNLSYGMFNDRQDRIAMHKYRTDPSDGMRPLKEFRKVNEK